MRAMRRSHLDATGAALLIVFTLILGVNQVVMKLTATGLSPLFQAGLRSVGAAICVGAWVRWRGIAFPLDRGIVISGIVLGAIFTLEFGALYLAIDMSTVSRVSIIFYSMPVHMSIAAHFLLPGERLNRTRMLGLVLAMAGVVVVMIDRNAAQASLAGDLLALVAALGWASIPLMLRLTPLSRIPAESAQLWQVMASAPMLLLLAPLFGPLVRDFGPEHVAYMAYQIVVVASFAFLMWFVLLRIYPASSVASFGFLTPIFSVLMAWVVLGETLHWNVLVSLVLVAAGLVLINRR
ncbi:EamA family transporter [Pseudooceanicola sp. 216_PA32_1]|uniref:EamA family transporter n=2 Tax=Pseudooceanicola pacificus TaxID=2676438 RepID=A0A844WCQ7_9RHOB|nr:EamA family transporter [Pseudooceanicola pacificus]